jgi:hypothetical protein
MGSASATPANQPTYVEEPAMYIALVTMTPGQNISDLAVNIDRDSDFMLTGLNGTSDGAYTLNFRLPSGRQIANAQILNTDILGTANQPTAIGPPPIYRAGSTGPQLTLTEISGAVNNARIIFSGIRRIRTT